MMAEKRSLTTGLLERSTIPFQTNIKYRMLSIEMVIAG
ncbi:unnamed protein product [Brugia timori]|uniref:Uncharacterized protein n=1 Tax=Brugia timori TaxID=42155 RepID=A0A0R3R968_9BILA|nr:unnamed protein product [Brugia timori]